MATYTVQDTTMTALGDAIRKQVFGESNIVETQEISLMNSEGSVVIPLNYSEYNKVIVEILEIISIGMSIVEGKVGMTFYGTSTNSPFDKLDETGWYATESEVYEFYTKENYDFISLYTTGNIKIRVTIIPTDKDYNEYKYTPAEMVDEIDGLICLTEDDLIFTKASYLNYNGIWDNIIQKIGNHIILQNCYSLQNTFYGSKLEDLSMITIDGGYNKLSSTFNDCNNLKYLPTVKSYQCWCLDDTFAGCRNLRSLGNFFDNTTISNNGDTTASWGSAFDGCYSLRTIPQKVLNALWNNYSSYYGSVYNTCFRYCYTLDEIIGLGVNSSYFYTPTQNYFRNTFDYCFRLKNITFLTNEDGTPISSDMINQIIDLSVYVGYGNSENNIIAYNSGITVDKKVYDDATYQALKNDPDWYSLDINYSRYNHDSAVNTINSLPDVSADGINTIKFKGSAGALTDGGAINTLTEEEIAVASAKGWTVSLV